MLDQILETHGSRPTAPRTPPSSLQATMPSDAAPSPQVARFLPAPYILDDHATTIRLHLTDLRALHPLMWSHVTPCGTVNLGLHPGTAHPHAAAFVT